MIPNVTAQNVVALPFKDMLKGLEPYVLEPVPEGAAGDAEALHAIDRLIGRFANLYTYMIFLYSVVAHESLAMKLLGDDTAYSILQRKKDALYELARGVRYKHEACSRMLTAHITGQEGKAPFDRIDHQARAQKAGKKSMHGWEAVK